MVSPFTETELPPPQKQNLFDLLKGLNAQILADIAKSRARALGSDPVEKLNHLIQIGPFMGSEAKDEGLVDGLVYKRDCGKMIEKQGAFGLAHYMRVKAKEHTNKLAKTGEPSLVVGIIYLIGGIKRYLVMLLFLWSRNDLRHTQDSGAYYLFISTLFV